MPLAQVENKRASALERLEFDTEFFSVWTAPVSDATPTTPPPPTHVSPGRIEFRRHFSPFIGDCC